jgi:hypothetical protein
MGKAGQILATSWELGQWLRSSPSGFAPNDVVSNNLGTEFRVINPNSYNKTDLVNKVYHFLKQFNP